MLHIIKRFFALMALYITIIIGIFVLQFRSETSITKTFGSLRLSLLQADNIASPTLQDYFRIDYKGISLLSSEDGIQAVAKNSSDTHHIILKSYEQSSAKNIILHFSDNINISFTQIAQNDTEALQISASLPNNIEQVKLPWTTTSSTQVTQRQEKQLLLSYKDKIYALSGDNITDNIVELATANPTVLYHEFNPKNEFSFAGLVSQEIADEDVYNSNLTEFKKDLITKFNTAVNSGDNSAITEKVVMAYMAQMAQDSRYKVALATVPQYFVQGQRRTYLTSCYFGSIVQQNASLDTRINQCNALITKAVADKNLNVLDTPEIASFISLYRANNNVKAFLDFIENIHEVATLEEATSIVDTYTKLVMFKDENATKFQTALDKSLALIESACDKEKDDITIMQYEEELSQVECLKLAASLVHYSQISKDSAYGAAGRAIFNTYIKKQPLSLSTMADLYPFLASDNLFYPRMQIISRDMNLWAWSCACGFDFVHTQSLDTLTIDFPAGDTHYIILRGLKPFSSIQIYDMNFRTDPRFEMYDSSGYVYNSITKTLFLKSLHKTRKETIRFYPISTVQKENVSNSPASRPSPTVENGASQQ